MILVPLNLSGISLQWKDWHEVFLIAAFNKIPKQVTAENILRRPYRAWLLQITDELNSTAVPQLSYDLFDVVLKLGSLRKNGKLRNRSFVVQ